MEADDGTVMSMTVAEKKLQCASQGVVTSAEAGNLIISLFYKRFHFSANSLSYAKPACFEDASVVTGLHAVTYSGEKIQPDTLA